MTELEELSGSMCYMLFCDGNILTPYRALTPLLSNSIYNKCSGFDFQVPEMKSDNSSCNYVGSPVYTSWEALTHTSRSAFFECVFILQTRRFLKYTSMELAYSKPSSLHQLLFITLVLSEVLPSNKYISRTWETQKV